MEFDWDDDKDAANRAKHGVGLEQAAQLDWDNGVRFEDKRRDYGEKRQIVYARIDGRLYACVYVLREGRRRIISLRKANGREERDYG